VPCFCVKASVGVYLSKNLLVCGCPSIDFNSLGRRNF
jgi:hypothetical protein